MGKTLFNLPLIEKLIQFCLVAATTEFTYECSFSDFFLFCPEDFCLDNITWLQIDFFVRSFIFK